MLGMANKHEILPTQGSLRLLPIGYGFIEIRE